MVFFFKFFYKLEVYTGHGHGLGQIFIVINALVRHF